MSYKLVGDQDPIVSRLGEFLPGIGFDLVPVEDGDTGAGAEEVLVAESFSAQNPAGLDTPLQIEFGPAQFGPTDPVQLSAEGAVTFNQTGVYYWTAVVYVERTSAAGDVVFLARTVKNSVQVGNPIGLHVDTRDQTTPLFLDALTLEFPVAGDVISLECMRDSSGIDNGGLVSIATLGGWGPTPSAKIRIVKL